MSSESLAQISGLPLKLSVKMQINLAMHDVSNMANVELFSNLVIPMLWFEIVSDKSLAHAQLTILLCIHANRVQVIVNRGGDRIVLAIAIASILEIMSTLKQ